ncbi:MAG: TIR domain-containing protein, partial [Verrucomicrobia bacterium]|nr:TIR domain-containing protein [Verrucomicrobiota bacterium]
MWPTGHNSGSRVNRAPHQNLAKLQELWPTGHNSRIGVAAVGRASSTRPPRGLGSRSGRRPPQPRDHHTLDSLNVSPPKPIENRPVPGGAVFLSYAREDTVAAQRIADTLRAGGIEVWFDLTGLVGGDAWDGKIRRQIKECALFMPIVSANTQARTEGYFRLEWRLADQRTHLMGKSRAFLVPVCIDETREAEADAPDSFLAVQWTRLPGGATPPAFCERVQRLLAGSPMAPEIARWLQGEAGAVKPVAGGPAAAARTSFRFGRLAVGASAVVILTTVAWWLFGRKTAGPADATAAVSPARPPSAAATHAQESAAKASEPARGKKASEDGRQEIIAGAPRPGAHPAPTAEVTPASADTAAKAIAVLAFENLSGDQDNEPFCDGISDELLNLLGKVPGLVVKGRTSAFSFKGQRLDDSDIGRKLCVRYVVNGSIQKVGTRVRIVPRLVQAADGVVVWSDKFTEELKDIFALQDRIAGLIAQALQVKLGTALRTAQTVDPEAHRLVLEGRHYASPRTPDGFARAETALTQAIARDPDFAPAHAALAEVCVMRANYAVQDGASGSEVAADVQRARIEAQRAIAIDPANPEAYAALGYCDFMEARSAEAERQYQRAIELSPNQSIF